MRESQKLARALLRIFPFLDWIPEPINAYFTKVALLQSVYMGCAHRFNLLSYHIVRGPRNWTIRDILEQSKFREKYILKCLKYIKKKNPHHSGLEPWTTKVVLKAIYWSYKDLYRRAEGYYKNEEFDHFSKDDLDKILEDLGFRKSSHKYFEMRRRLFSARTRIDLGKDTLKTALHLCEELARSYEDELNFEEDMSSDEDASGEEDLSSDEDMSSKEDMSIGADLCTGQGMNVGEAL